jgi:hypothetical protein
VHTLYGRDQRRFVSEGHENPSPMEPRERFPNNFVELERARGLLTLRPAKLP